MNIKTFIFIVLASISAFAAPQALPKFDSGTLQALSGIVHDLRGPLRIVEQLTKDTYGDVHEQAVAVLASVDEFMAQAKALHQADSNCSPLDRRVIAAHLKPHFSEPLRRIEEGLRGARMDTVRAEVKNLVHMLEGKLEAHTNVEELLRQIAAFQQYEAQRKGLTLNVQLPSSLPMSLLNATALRRVVTNLVGNALKFTEKGSVTIGASITEGGEWHISVQDTGPGMADTSRIFHKFEQEANAAHCSTTGSGVGLWNVQQLVENELKGAIEVASIPGEGTTFTVKVLPAPSASPLKATPHPLSPPKAASAVVFQAKSLDLKDRHILVVDDSAANRLVATTQLKQLGLQVKAVGSAEEALVILQLPSATPMDFVLMDLDLGEGRMSGLDAVRRIRELGLTIPVLAFSAMLEDEQRQECLEAGMNGTVEKPISKVPQVKETLMALVRL